MRYDEHDVSAHAGRRHALAAALAVLLAILGGCIVQPPAARTVRFATFNTSLQRGADGQLIADLEAGDPQARAVAEIIQRVAPDVLLLNEFDYDSDGEAVRLFQDRYLAISQNGAPALRYFYRYLAPVNTGVPSGKDLDNDGENDGPGDAFGFGRHPGQYGMVLLSRFPIATAQVRTFQKLLWRDLPDAALPDDPDTPQAADWFSSDELSVVRLSSKSHWDVPIRVTGYATVHVLASHPTPPVFDGPEDRNGRRNHDEIRFWADYVTPDRSVYVRDDLGRPGGLPEGAPFVIMGDMNADPNDGDSHDGAVRQLLGHPRVLGSVEPQSRGAVEQAELSGGANTAQLGDPRLDTGDFPDDPAPGNLRVDYVLPSQGLPVLGSGVFWPLAADPLFSLVGRDPFPSSDHRLVWVDLLIAPPTPPDEPAGEETQP